MSSSFKGLNLFGSGPHRFALGLQGQRVVPDYVLGFGGAGTTPVGLMELDVIVTGRLVATSESAAWGLRDVITAQLLDPPAPGLLIDLHGREWTQMSFITFAEGARVDRGRMVSLAYVAHFRRFD